MASPCPILLVEDHPDDEKLAVRALRQSKVTSPQVAQDGEEGLTAIFTANPLHSVVLLDLELPNVNGLGILQPIRAHGQACLVPVVASSQSLNLSCIGS
jgi:two-component system, response regulator